jgi:hypothetical protein
MGIFLNPRLAIDACCPSCNMRIGFTGVFSWGVEIVGTLVTLALYQFVEGRWAEALLSLTVAMIFSVIEYWFAPLKVLGK